MAVPPEIEVDSRQRALRQLLARFAKERRFQAEDAPHEDDPNEYRISPLCYPGLRSFNPNEDQFFFGRRRNVTEIRRKLEAERIVVVQGGSGTGKSSVIRAGLIPRLRDTDSMKGRFGNWYAAEFRPRTDPLKNLAEGLADLLARKFADQPADLRQGAAGDGQPPADPDGSDYRSRVRDRLLNSFQHFEESARGGKKPNEGRAARAWALLNVLLDFAAEVDARDKLATDGLRAGPANLLLLVDQFEEVFRPEALLHGAELLDLLIAAHAFLTNTPEGRACGLYIVVTMRTEELHRVGEYPALTLPPELAFNARHSLTLADVVTSSFYLIQVLDPDQDRADLREAIVQPARDVLDEYGLLEGDITDAPFDDGVVDWLLDGARRWRDATGQGHKADQLPLLQHALRVMWRGALRRWKEELEAGKMPAMRIVKADLPQPEGPNVAQGADLAFCLDQRANRARDDAAREFSNAFASDEPGAHSEAAGMAALRAAMRALARRDDRGNWARRFATIQPALSTSSSEPRPAAMDDFLAIDPDTSSLPVHDRRRALAKALQVLKAAGYLSEGRSGEYDISHEALIRNWGQAQIWLREPSDTALAIERVLKDVDPSLIGAPKRIEELEGLMPRQLVERLAPIENPRSLRGPLAPVVYLPPQWSKEQIRLVDKPSAWGSDDDALEKLRRARREVIKQRQRLATKEERRRWRRRLVLVVSAAILVFIVLSLSGYQQVKEIAAGGGTMGVIGRVTSQRSINENNASRAHIIAEAHDYLTKRRSMPPADRDKLLEGAYSDIDFASRYVIGATLTPVDPTKMESNLAVKCWASADTTSYDIKIGGTKLTARLEIESGNVKLIRSSEPEGNAWKVEVDGPQIGAFLDAANLPPNGRVCITENGSTLIVATPWSFSVLSLLWRLSSDRVVLRAWPVNVVSGKAPEAGLPCVYGVHEGSRGHAVFTQVFYRLHAIKDGLSNQCANEASDAMAMAFVRGLHTPVLLPPSRNSDEDKKCLKQGEETPPSTLVKNLKDSVQWACEKASGEPITVNISEWPISSEVQGALLSLKHKRANETFSAEVVIDAAVISPAATLADVDIALSCHGGSISLVISNKSAVLKAPTRAVAMRSLGEKAAASDESEAPGQKWAYLIDSQAISGLLREMGRLGSGGKLKQGDLLSWLKGDENPSMSAAMMEFPAKVFNMVQGAIVKFFYPPPRSIC